MSRLRGYGRRTCFNEAQRIRFKYYYFYLFTPSVNVLCHRTKKKKNKYNKDITLVFLTAQRRVIRTNTVARYLKRRDMSVRDNNYNNTARRIEV